MPHSSTYGFGSFVLQGEDQTLREGTHQVPLGDKAMALLFALIERQGHVVSKAELMQRAWPNGSIDESTLRFHIASLRKALGEDQTGTRFIVNVSGRGYCFVAPVQRSAALHQSSVPISIPTPGPKLLGRDRALAELEQRLLRQRFVSLVGAGGMGKSSMAMSLAAKMGVQYPDGVFLLDVALIDEAHLVPTTLAHQLGLASPPGGATEALGRHLSDQQALLILDSCESQIDACAALAQHLLQQAPRLHVLATSREALRAPGEWVIQLRPLATPQSPWTELSAEEVLSYPSIQLVLERARAARPEHQLSATDLPQLCELVNRLDGMPLALELAAVRLGEMTLPTLLQQLDAKFLLRNGSRSRIDRHRTLGALLDWSYERLHPREQTVLRRLSVCRGVFSLETAQAIASDAALDRADVVEAVMGLAAKSLLSVDAETLRARYRLLDSTHAYAAEQLGEGEEYRLTRIRQFAHLYETLRQAEADSPRLALQEWLRVYGPLNNDMRSHLAWAFGPQGDTARAVQLVAAAVGFAHQLALAEEYAGHIRQALDRMLDLPQASPAIELQLINGLFVLLLISQGPGGETAKVHARALELAEQLGSIPHQVEAHNGLFVQAYFGDGDYPSAAKHAMSVARLAVDNEELQPLITRLRLQSLHGLGQHEQARQGLETLIRHPPKRQRLRPPYPIDMSVMARMLLVRIHWLQGRADDAIGLVEELQHLAERDVRLALPNAYSWAICPLHLWCGNHEQARIAIEALHRCASQIGVAFSGAWACAYDLVWARRTGMAQRLANSRLASTQASASGVVAELLGTIDPFMVTPALVRRLEQGSLGWCAPEISRAAGEQAWRQHKDRQGARQLYEQARALASQQGALAWELRAVTSLASLSMEEGHHSQAVAALEPVYERFVQGFDTEDLRKARALLNAQTVG